MKKLNMRPRPGFSCCFVYLVYFGFLIPGVLALEPETAKLKTEDAYTVDAGATELELTYAYVSSKYTFSKSNNRNKRDTNHAHGIDLSITHGIAERFDAGLGFAWGHITDHEEDGREGDGFGDIVASLKWLFYQDDDVALGISYVPGFVIPIGETSDVNQLGPGQDYWSFDQLIALTKNWGRITSSYDIGYSLAFGKDRGSERGVAIADAALGYQVNEWFQPQFEVNYEHGFVRTETDSDIFSLSVGAIFNIQESWRIDAGFLFAVYGKNADQPWAGILNLSYTF